MLGRALAENKMINEKTSQSASVYNEFKEKFDELIGEPIIWRTKGNTNLKAPQLVVVERAYEHFVLVVKTTFNVEGSENKIRYGISYSSLYCGFDSYETLEFSV